MRGVAYQITYQIAYQIVTILLHDSMPTCTTAGVTCV